jgi:hypothetical protein
VVPRFKVASNTHIFIMTTIRLTPLMKQRLTRRAYEMVVRSLICFPELKETTITIGYTRKHLGSATVVYRTGVISQLIIRLKVRNVTYQTIGNLTAPRATDSTRIPSGETQCDIWTLARDPLFCDDPPTYIKMPRIMRERWAEYSESVRELCIAAIEKRHTQRHYIRWLEDEIRKLAKAPVEKKIASAQLALPFII